MKSYIFSFVLFLGLVAFSPSADAYFSTAQEAYRINNHLALFQIDYTFGSENHAIYLPVRAERNQAWGTENKKIGFSILKDGKVTDEGEAIGVVKGPVTVSVANSSNEQYVTPAGHSINMSFFVILEVAPNATSSQYRVQVTDLPFYVGEDLEYQKLNPSELQYYKTPAVSLNRNQS